MNESLAFSQSLVVIFTRFEFLGSMFPLDGTIPGEQSARGCAPCLFRLLLSAYVFLALLIS